MLINVHHVAAILNLDQVPAAERSLHQDSLSGLLVALYRGANAAARVAFTKRIEALPQGSGPWGAVTKPEPSKVLGLGPPIPPVLLLLLGQVDDDPDSAEDGNRLPDRDSKAGAPWAGLYAALDRWDVPMIRQHMGPFGWWLPTDRAVPLDEGAAVELAPAKVVVRPAPPAKATAQGGRRATATAPGATEGTAPAPTSTDPESAPAVPPKSEDSLSSLSEAIEQHWPLFAGTLALGVATTAATVFFMRRA